MSSGSSSNHLAGVDMLHLQGQQWVLLRGTTVAGGSSTCSPSSCQQGWRQGRVCSWRTVAAVLSSSRASSLGASASGAALKQMQMPGQLGLTWVTVAMLQLQQPLVLMRSTLRECRVCSA